MTTLQYPIGPFAHQPSPLTSEARAALIDRIAALPARIRSAVADLTDDQLDVPYRDGGWSARQITHHLADSHMNALIRVKLALTEDHPTIRPYDQDAWSEHADVLGMPIETSLSILDGLHQRWVQLWRSMEPSHFDLMVNHPEIGEITVDFLLQMYGWHGDHHATQVEQLRERQGW